MGFGESIFLFLLGLSELLMVGLYVNVLCSSIWTIVIVLPLDRGKFVIWRSGEELKSSLCCT